MFCREVLLLEPFKHPRQSKERGEIWGEIAQSLNSIISPKFKFSKRFVRDRLTLLLAKYKEKMRKEEQAQLIWKGKKIQIPLLKRMKMIRLLQKKVD